MEEGRPPAGQRRAPNIVLVEDEEAVRELLAEMLQTAGFRVTPLRLAADLLDLLLRDIPDVVVLDLGMPAGELHGIDVLGRVRANPAWATLPVVILSGIGEVLNPDIAKGFAVSAVLGKPVHSQHLVRTLEAVLRR